MPYKNSKYKRYRQLPPKRFQTGTFRTVPITHTPYSGKKFRKKGTKAIVGKEKRTGKWKTQSYLVPKKSGKKQYV